LKKGNENLPPGHVLLLLISCLSLPSGKISSPTSSSFFPEKTVIGQKFQVTMPLPICKFPPLLPGGVFLPFDADPQGRPPRAYPGTHQLSTDRNPALTAHSFRFLFVNRCRCRGGSRSEQFLAESAVNERSDVRCCQDHSPAGLQHTEAFLDERNGSCTCSITWFMVMASKGMVGEPGGFPSRPRGLPSPCWARADLRGLGIHLQTLPVPSPANQPRQQVAFSAAR